MCFLLAKCLSLFWGGGGSFREDLYTSDNSGCRNYFVCSVSRNVIFLCVLAAKVTGVINPQSVTQCQCTAPCRPSHGKMGDWSTSPLQLGETLTCQVGGGAIWAVRMPRVSPSRVCSVTDWDLAWVEAAEFGCFSTSSHLPTMVWPGNWPLTGERGGEAWRGE